MIFKNRISIILTTALIFTMCESLDKTYQVRRPFWGDSIKTVIQIEQRRLGSDPIKRHVSNNSNYQTLVYNDRIFSTDSTLAYYFKNDKLVFMIYSSSDPDWDKDEFNYQIHDRLSALYGEPSEIKLGIKTCYHWTASDAYIYYMFRRKHQDRTFWRTFLAVIVYSSQTIEKSSYLRSILVGIK